MRPFEEKSPWVDNSQFQSDDFPALSGFQRPKQLADNDEQTTSTQKSTEESAKPVDKSPVDNVPTVEVKTCVETLPDGTMKNIPATMLTDQFGMAGLVASLRDQAGNPLAFGTDLQNLGLKYHSSVDSLCTNFAGPWDGRSTLIQDIEVNVPEEYKMKLKKKPHVYAIMREAGIDLLFYLFYHCPNEIYQLIAASELHRRDWRFHKTEKIWVTRSTSGILEHTQTYEKGTFNVFDPLQGRQMPRAMTLEYRLLEDRPIVPTGLTDPPLFRSGPAMTNMQPQMFHQQQAGPSHTHRQSRGRSFHELYGTSSLP